MSTPSRLSNIVFFQLVMPGTPIVFCLFPQHPQKLLTSSSPVMSFWPKKAAARSSSTEKAVRMRS